MATDVDRKRVSAAPNHSERSALLARRAAFSSIRASSVSIRGSINCTVSSEEMPKPSEFVSHLLDLLSPLGGVSARAMFGGWGFYHGGKMFALVAYETFFVKVDDTSRPEFDALGLGPFVYASAGGKRTVMACHTVPATALDSSELLCEWARKGVEAARRAALKPAARKGSRTTPAPTPATARKSPRGGSPARRRSAA
jgi:DNA transformation protein and related proteins